MTKIKESLVIAFVIVLGIAAAVTGYSSYKNGEEATVERLAQALLKNDQTMIKKSMPTFSTKQKISTGTRKMLQHQIRNLKSKEQVVAFLQDEDHFSIKKGASLFEPAKIYPIPRTIELELPQEARLKARLQGRPIVGNYDEDWRKVTFGPFLSGEYELTYELTHPKFGQHKTKERIDLKKTDQRVIIKENNLYDGNAAFQQHLLASAVNYFDSMNEAIRNDLNVSRMAASKEHKEKLQQSFEKLKPYMENFQQSFQTIQIDCDSIAVNRAQTKVQLDLYVDLKRSMKLIEETGIDEALVSDKQNAIAHFLYDEEQKKWLIDELIFDTFQQDPEKWEQSKSYRGQAEKTAQWCKTSGDNVV